MNRKGIPSLISLMIPVDGTHHVYRKGAKSTVFVIKSNHIKGIYKN